MEPTGVTTPVKNPKLNRSKPSISSKHSENQNPNNSPLTKSATKCKKPVPKNPNPVSPLLKTRIRERKFVVPKKSKRTEALNRTAAYEKLRASQEEFFKNRIVENVTEDGDDRNEGLIQEECLNADEGLIRELEIGRCVNEDGVVELKRSREKLVEDVRKSLPEPGSGRVMSLIKAFDCMKMENSNGRDEKKGPDVVETQLSLSGDGASDLSPSFCPADLFLTYECLGLDTRRSSSLDSNRRKSDESNGAMARRQWRKKQQLKTTAKPFKLRTEERGKCKEEEFMKKIQQMKEEEEKLRVPIAQGLPWTTDEPECLVKPPIKEATKPIDLVLHSDVRAEERAEFDHQVAEKMSYIEQYRMERERLQKLAEEEEIRRLRKELVPKAQPLPYFDRPFIPRRSEKQPTIPKEPKFHLGQNKKIKCMQKCWSDTSSFISITDTWDRL